MAMQFKGFVLNDFQEKAVRAIREGKSVLVSAPTGAGKTLVAEYAIQQAIREGKKVIYTAPIKALSNQKYRDFRDDPEVEVGLMTGDVTLQPNAPLLIMTTEIYRNTLFEDPKRVEDVAWVIFDEIHYMDDPERGTVWEESLMFSPENIRFICLSATVANLREFGEWIRSIRSVDLEIIHSDKRPVPLHHKLYHRAAGVFELSKLQAARKKALGNRKKGRPPRRSQGGIHQASMELLDYIQQRKLLPVLYFSFSRRECEIKAERNSARRRLLSASERKRMEELFDRICALYQLDWRKDPELRYLRDRALKGMAFHHAGMLPIHKEIVERLFTSGLIKMLFTTETFALGVNMPARTVAFNQIRKFDGVSVDFLKTRDYLQMAGRAGRQGIDEEGMVFSILDTDDLFEAPLKRIIQGKVEPIRSHFNLSYSTILNLYSRLGPNLVKAYERSFAHFQAEKRGKKYGEKAHRRMTASIVAKIHVLREAGYIDDRGLLDRGKVASKINGYEIQITELLFQGLLDEMDLDQLNAVFGSIVYEARRGDTSYRHPGAVLKGLETKVARAIDRFRAIEAAHGIKDTIKAPDFDIAPALAAWSRGVDFPELARYTSVTPGDLVRTIRMSVQMLRQLRKCLSGDYPLRDRLAEALVCVNRDVVDAKRQLELG